MPNDAPGDEPKTTSDPVSQNPTASDVPDKDARLTGEPGEIKKEGYKETHIGDDGKADQERHWTDHGKPKHHSNPHDHDITWTDQGKPSFGAPKNYWDATFPIFPS